MIKKIILIVTICFTSFGFQLRGCQPQDYRINVMSPDVKAELVFFFKKGTDWKEILEFQRTVTGIPNQNGSGFSDLPGIMTGVKIDINGFEGEAINYQPSATEEQKAFVKKRVSESPLVYRVYENVIPNQIKDLPSQSQETNSVPDLKKSERKKFIPAPTPSPRNF